MDEKKLKALAAELANGLKTEADLNQFSRMLTKLTVETALNAGLTDHLGHEKNVPKKGSNTRNGYSSKTLLCESERITGDVAGRKRRREVLAERTDRAEKSWPSGHPDSLRGRSEGFPGCDKQRLSNQYNGQC
ncbi:transposase IS1113 [Salmonella enterica subsp. houtenae serovar Houten]|nr:transposase IS1113 [Salmonella enterica subsp. houtenae serovar Houten]SUF52365.1 transposase IS1113 [Salmonella enterica]VFS07945.1 transposase IS1113 [Salmonella enterica subsp. houtenae]VUD25668.1 transposase IS1113 [Salmonella sp. NCTC 7297]